MRSTLLEEMMDPLVSLNVVAVFNSCLEIFRLVQKGRKFGEEYERRVAIFEAAKHRLVIWGERVAITKDTLLQPNFAYDVGPIFSALRQLEQLFRKVQECLKKYEIQVQGSKELTPTSTRRQSFKEWNKSQKDQAQQREKQTKIYQKAKFVVLDAETLDNLFVDIKYFLEFLDISTQSASSGRQSHFRDSFGVSSVSDASSFNEPSRRLSEPSPFEYTCRVWGEPDFDRQLSNLELSTQQPTTTEIMSAGTSISAFIAPRRRDSFPMFKRRKKQQKNLTWAPSLASISSSTVEGFSSRSLNLYLDGRRCLASALNRSQLAILTSSEVYLFDTNQNPLLGQQLKALGRHSLDEGTWTGVAIAGSYLAAWGEKVVGFKTAHRKVLASDWVSSVLASSCCP
jgi:hypothetical protein